MSSVKIHPTAIVEKGAELGAGVEIGPNCLVGPRAQIGDGTVLRSHVVVEGVTRIGARNTVYAFSSLGGAPQDTSYKGEETTVEIGDDNIFRESVTIHRGTVKGRQKTVVGSRNMLMVGCHVAHDCTVGSDNILANQVALAGHVDVEDFVVIGGIVGITQFCRVGAYSFMGAGTVLRRDLPPFMAAKDFSEVMGPNLVGLKRRGLTNQQIRTISELYKVFYKSGKTLAACISELEERFAGDSTAERFINFVKSSKVGIQR
ncbi:MAG TPA: acyl-ACP--UDP-N-acetylglucosamine O-acyltransferase [Bdellovibrionota bacterium]|jgi:UDP-N-acetylglucosamine acyltransferase|nr:acyl-ACP--UDP-N-acetylglucosamine O-acyltransferase [Bdellovibrionota bacterium]